MLLLFSEEFKIKTMAQLRYPYTLGAMIMRFPLKYHIQKSWVFKVRAELLLS